jgi:nucleoside-diphosphate-sugar epimerase
MKTLVTGGTGCIGSTLAERLIAKGYDVRALARRTSNLSHLRTTGAEIVFGDIAQYDSLPPVVRGIDMVFHCAAKVTPGWGTWPEYEANTVKGTENMLRASAEAGVRRFLQVSSVSIHGDALQRSKVPAKEDTPCEARKTPDTYYEYAKLMAEQACWECQKQGKIEVSMIRVPAAYGPRDKLLTDRLYINTVLPIVMWPGSGNPRCSVVHTHDIAELGIRVANSDKSVGRVYNVAGPGAVTLKDFAKAMARAQGGPKIWVTVPYSAAYLFAALIEDFTKLRRSKGIPFLSRYYIRHLRKQFYVDGSRAKRELGWTPEISLEDGTRQYVEWRRHRKKAVR